MFCHNKLLQIELYVQQNVLKVIKVLSRYCDCVERASIDEAFLDVTSLVMDRLKLLQQTCPQDIPLITSSMLLATHVAGYSVNMEIGNKGSWFFEFVYYVSI